MRPGESLKLSCRFYINLTPISVRKELSDLKILLKGKRATAVLLGLCVHGC